MILPANEATTLTSAGLFIDCEAAICPSNAWAKSRILKALYWVFDQSES
jgi:hypothetical protein